MKSPHLFCAPLFHCTLSEGLPYRGQRHTRKWTTSLEVVQQKTESTEVAPEENNHVYHLKQGKGPEKENFQDNEG